MIIARQKRKENIAEYILYMWQLEDLFRAYNFQMDKINREIVSEYKVSAGEKVEIGNWYAELIESMRAEKVLEQGHLQILDSLVDDLNDFHFRMIESPFHSDYQELYQDAVHNISDFRLKMKIREKIADMEVCLTVLYGYMLMKMKKRPVSDDTIEAIETIRRMIALLASKHKAFEEGSIEL
ncbi:MAG: hypothetical protein A2X22_13445 [Bacteroidetes bacterium GWF2_49_14]|nr:MAG: hypothetical protein A2X22_13445 [Bacteroidetes bacterium GWF2_49_14]